MNAAHPMDEQNDLGCFLVDIGDHLMDKCADDTLLQPRIGGGSGPDALEVGCERRKRCRIDCRYGLFRVMGSDLAFNFGNARKRLVPTRFQFTSYKAVGRLGGVGLPEAAIGCIAPSFEIAHKHVAYLIPLLPSLSF